MKAVKAKCKIKYIDLGKPKSGAPEFSGSDTQKMIKMIIYILVTF